ncbi:heat-inducible transcription repressor [Carnobacterium sp. 17-4]|nr:heat-inducible transcription repressor [Carnobacterium sp. 17-4]
MNEAEINFSSATIRNEMGRLEELGFIEKTHSSSGRVPSLKGYRFYVDHLVHPAKIQKKDLAVIKSALGNQFRQLDEIVFQSAELLSRLTSYTAITLGSEIKESILTGFRLVPLNDYQVMAILVTDKGHVENQIVTIPRSMDVNELEKIVRIFNEQLVGLPLMEVFKRLKTEIPILLNKYVRTNEGILNIFEDVFLKAGQDRQDRMHVGGRMNILDFSNELNVEKFKSIYSLMDGTHDLSSLLVPSTTGINVKIGTELNNELFNEFSLITASYDIEGYSSGVIALLGPTNMPYSKMIGLVDVFRNELSKKIIDYYQVVDD